MPLTLEALAAREGDALLLRFGTPAEPVLWVIDGGPRDVYKNALRVRLDQLRGEQDLDVEVPLWLDLVVVTHVDADHVRGVLDLFGDMVDAAGPAGRPAPYRIARVWHNSFDAMVDDPTVGPSLAAHFDLVMPGAPRQLDATAASIADGRRLADLVRRFDLGGNRPFDGLVAAPRVVREGRGGAEVTVVGPDISELSKLADEWEMAVGHAVDRGDLAEAAAYVDRSVTNLSSIALHVAVEGRSALLTGDARGDRLLEGIERAGLLADGVCHVDVLKVPHHGSDRNVDREFFERLTADHYVISADGRYGNPSPQVLDWIVDTQGNRDYEIDLTYGDAMGAADYLRWRQTAASQYTVRVRQQAGVALAVTV